eukprot:CAMPEP_0183819590 /NCGR_PEP_ID=MMETSP0803_2-20130417/64212_1 /TAXON_ID=195967 /ORGANISM="Crustomastix stigmata, Strain CCMP3273" /LENGTH=1299 /DNA_ID=CAMNT_0026064479 /DNA_START=69 /DNA_END=3966 /DNA_ORIENTATION=+
MAARRAASSVLQRVAALGAAPAAFQGVAPARTLAAAAAADDANLLKTVLYDMHVAAGGKMVPFAGWSMPIQYKDSIMESTKWCRENASLFDVSHMCGLSLKGKDCIPFMESLVVADLAGLADGTGTLSVFTNEKGGIIDDTVITKVNDKHLYLVVNAGCREKDLNHIEAHMKAFVAKGGDVSWHIHDENSLLALQGPKAGAVLQSLVKEDLSKFYFGMFQPMEVMGKPCLVTRTGYTGEDGFEIAVPDEHAVELATALTSKDEVRWCGLGPRDSLRLEAGLCLYGNDLEQHISPVEAGLTWTIGKRRREKFDFLGGETVAKHVAEGVPQRRVGFITTGAPARQHSKVLDLDGNEVGEITSGGFSPCLQKNIAMGYVNKALAKAGTELKVQVRNKVNDATVTKMPFVPTPYYKPPKRARGRRAQERGLCARGAVGAVGRGVSVGHARPARGGGRRGRGCRAGTPRETRPARGAVGAVGRGVSVGHADQRGAGGGAGGAAVRGHRAKPARPRRPARARARPGRLLAQHLLVQLREELRVARHPVPPVLDEEREQRPLARLPLRHHLQRQARREALPEHRQEVLHLRCRGRVRGPQPELRGVRGHGFHPEQVGEHPRRRVLAHPQQQLPPVGRHESPARVDVLARERHRARQALRQLAAAEVHVVQGEHVRVEVGEDVPGGRREDVEDVGAPLVQAHVPRPAPERRALLQREGVHGQELHRLREDEPAWPRGRRPRRAHAELLECLRRLLLHHAPRLLQAGHLRALRGEPRDECDHGVHVHGPEHLAHRRHHGHGERVHPDPPLPARRRVQQRALQEARREPRRGALRVVRDLHAERLVRARRGQGEQVGGPDEEVAVEGAYPEPAAAPDPDHALPRRLAQEVVPQLRVHPGAVPVAVEAGVEVQLAPRVLGEHGEARDVHVRRPQREDVHAYLHPAALRAHLLEEAVRGHAEGVLPVSAVHAAVVPVLEPADAHGRQRGLEHEQLAAHVAHHHVRRAQRAPHGALHVARPAEHAGERREQRVHLRPAVREVHEEVLGHGHVRVVEVGHDELPGLRATGPEVVEVYRAVIRHEAHVRPPVPLQPVQAGRYRLHGAVQRAAGHGGVAHVQREDVGGRHRRAHHVLLPGNVLHAARGELRAVADVCAPALVVQRAEVLHVDVVELPAHVAPVPPPPVGELEPGVDIGAALAAPHDAPGAEAHHGDGAPGRRQGLHHGAHGEREGRLLGRRLGQGVHRQLHEGGVAVPGGRGAGLGGARPGERGGVLARPAAGAAAAEGEAEDVGGHLVRCGPGVARGRRGAGAG